MELPYVPPYRIKAVEKIQPSTREQREKWIKATQYNLMDLAGSRVFIDVMTDSGTGGMSTKQWASMMTSDESYAGSESFVKLKNTIRAITGYNYILPAHQGRAAEHVFFSYLINDGDIIPGNSHFFTTSLHLKDNGGTPVDCTVEESADLTSAYPFKGNLDLEKLEDVYQKYGKENIPCAIVTITCNSVGGQPVSLENIKAVAKLSKKYGIPVYYDAARFAQNAYFIKMREAGYKAERIKTIIREIFDLADGMFMSSKKDGLVNMGGFIALKNEKPYQKTAPYTVLYEGFTTYGGMSGHTMEALAQGLKEAITFDYLKSRIEQVQYLGHKLDDYGVPVQKPFSGHAIFLRALQLLPHIPRDQFPSHVLAVELYKEAGIRAGNGNVYPAQKNPGTGKIEYTPTDLLRLTIPQRLYTVKHLDYIAAAIKTIYDRRDNYKTGYKISYEPEAMVMKGFGFKLEKTG